MSVCVFSIRFFLKKKRKKGDIVLIYTEIESPELLSAFETIDVGSSEISIALIAYIFFIKKGDMEHTLFFLQ